ncbi:MAG TPA: peptide chain release factor N(5)-glutamine methyltransferase, partial [Candidatus Acidoferrales bacterium]|nr:peptide chain release factor N(5)-glutamine methyltransferase [Candidatus Acidoferrales bacterium]
MRVTVLEAIQKSTEFLGKKNVESPRLQTELLLAHLLKMPRMKLYLNFDRELSAVETDELRELVRRRGQREPLQHIVGVTSFCGLDISVNRQALIPRPETELLAEEGWQFLQELKRGLRRPAGREAGALTALDFGTGTGCIAIALAVKCPGAKITALEVSAGALALARENAAKHQVAEQIGFLLGNGLAALAGGADNPLAGPRCFDLIISNPPYIPTAEIAALEPEVRDFDPPAALNGGAKGLDFYR